MEILKKLMALGLLGMIYSPVYSAESTENTLSVAEEDSESEEYSDAQRTFSNGSGRLAPRHSIC